MEAKLNIPEEFADRIAERVLEHLKPYITATNKKEDDTIFTIDELAQYLKVDKNWIYQRTRFHEIPYIKKGKYCRFKKSAIDAWLNQDAIRPLPSSTIRKKLC